ncbi:BTAD domain-containing putative transcriptional regulator [Streptomyces sp. NK15101]|uniref:ATP-binding protein n=1 Tax=Streptomyces sp. NK15101 TaxID=2873261 RepID=UPI001CECE809|nr:BTAD domain-containing putative transcriptional regulator [Streptomyces sp. NK15101]
MNVARQDDDVRQNEDGAPPLLRLRLLGGFRAERDGGPALPGRWPRPSAQTLVKLLAVVPGHSLHRGQVQEICWPNATPQAAVGSLRVALHAARHALEPEIAPRAASSYLVSDGALLRLDPRRVWIDADEAEALSREALNGVLIGKGKDSGGSVPVRSGDALTAALDAYGGELLPEDRYAPWAEQRRSELSSLRLRVLLALAELRLADGSYEEASGAARQVLATAPAEERAHRLLMTACLEQGLHAQVVRQYEQCRDALAEELGIAPGPETERLRRLAVRSSPGPRVRPEGTVTGAPLPSAVQAATSGTLHGREELLRTIVTTTHVPVVLLSGEAGIGKTRLAAQAAARLAESGATVLWGAAHDAEGHMPYGPFVEALHGWLTRRPQAHRTRVASLCPELVPLLPSLHQVAGGASPTPPGARGVDAPDERARLFHGVERLLTEIGGDGGVVVVLDDLQAADAGTHHLLVRLARRLSEAGDGFPCRFLVTLRDDEPLPEADLLRVDELVRAGLAARFAVPRLGRKDALALAREVRAPLGPGGDERDLDRVWRLSLGNPLFTVELARAGTAHQGEERSGAPEGVRQLVARRLLRLEPRARRMAEVVAAAGGTAPLAEVLDIARDGLHPPMSTAEAIAALEGTVAASLLAEQQIVVGGRSVTGLAFRHPLLRLTCYELLSRLRSLSLHAAWSETLLRHRPGDVDALVWHLLRAEDRRAVDHLRRAAERAAALYANEEADGYYRRLTPLVAADPVRAADVGMDHGALLHRMSRYGDAADVLRAALASADRAGAADTAVAVTARLAEALIRTGRQDEARRALDARRPGPTTPPDAVAAHRLASSIIDFVEGRHTGAVKSAAASAAAAADLPGRAGARALARALAQQAVSLGLTERLREAQAAAEEALPHAVAAGDASVEALVLSILRENARRTGRLTDAVSYGERAAALADRVGSPEASSFERTNLAELHLLLGRDAEAERLAVAAEQTARTRAPRTLPYALTALARTRMTWNPPMARALLSRAEGCAEQSGEQQAFDEVRLATAELALRTGRPEEALSFLGTGATAPRAACLRGWALVRTGRHSEAVTLLEREAARADRTGQHLLAVETTTVLALALGLSGLKERASALLADARYRAESLPYPAGLARVRTAEAELLT